MCTLQKPPISDTVDTNMYFYSHKPSVLFNMVNFKEIKLLQFIELCVTFLVPTQSEPSFFMFHLIFKGSNNKWNLNWNNWNICRSWCEKNCQELKTLCIKRQFESLIESFKSGPSSASHQREAETLWLHFNRETCFHNSVLHRACYLFV